jgi:hypothetical protein
VDDVGSFAAGVVAAAVVAAVAAVDSAVVEDVTATVSGTPVVDGEVDADEPEALEHAAINRGLASHRNRALARVMMANSTTSAADALVIETGPSPVVSLQEIAGIDDGSACHRFGDFGDVEPAELVPLGQHREYVCTVAC